MVAKAHWHRLGPRGHSLTSRPPASLAPWLPSLPAELRNVFIMMFYWNVFQVIKITLQNERCTVVVRSCSAASDSGSPSQPLSWALAGPGTGRAGPDPKEDPWPRTGPEFSEDRADLEIPEKKGKPQQKNSDPISSQMLSVTASISSPSPSVPGPLGSRVPPGPHPMARPPGYNPERPKNKQQYLRCTLKGR